MWGGDPLDFGVHLSLKTQAAHHPPADLTVIYVYSSKT